MFQQRDMEKSVSTTPCGRVQNYKMSLAYVLLQLRKSPIPLVADRTEKFFQVSMPTRNRQHHCFSLRGVRPNKKPKVYETIRLLFGDRASPYNDGVATGLNYQQMYCWKIDWRVATLMSQNRHS